jgi:hypothetical protein
MLDSWLMVNGDTSLHNTVFAELPQGVLNESGVHQGGRRSRSTSPVPPSSSRKHAASSSVQQAGER